MFVDPAQADLHLVSSATNAIDKGLTLSTVTNDFDGDRRPRGASADIGADEFTINTPPQITGISLTGTNATVSFTGSLGESYDLLIAHALAERPWSVVGTNIPGTAGGIQVLDTNGFGLTQGFYRVRISP